MDQTAPIQSVINSEENLNLEFHVRALLLKALNKHNGDIDMAGKTLGVSGRILMDWDRRFKIAWDTVQKAYVSLFDYQFDIKDKGRFIFKLEIPQSTNAKFRKSRIKKQYRIKLNRFADTC